MTPSDHNPTGSRLVCEGDFGWYGRNEVPILVDSDSIIQNQGEVDPLRPLSRSIIDKQFVQEGKTPTEMMGGPCECVLQTEHNQ